MGATQNEIEYYELNEDQRLTYDEAVDHGCDHDEAMKVVRESCESQR